MKRTLKTMCAILFATTLAGTPAWAAYAGSSYGEAWSSGSVMYVKDTRADNRSVYGGYYRVGSTGPRYVYNYSGAGSTVSRNVGSRITTVQICINQWGPDTCSKWR